MTYFCGCHDRGVIQKVLIYKKPTLAYDTINKISDRLELGQKHLLATQSFMLHERQSSGNCQKETIHGV